VPTPVHKVEQSILARPYLLLLIRAWGGRRVAVTRKGYVCPVPRHAREGDAIRLISGAQTLFVVRIEEEGPSYKLAVDCYTWGDGWKHG
jgi:hypothetical protein